MPRAKHLSLLLLAFISLAVNPVISGEPDVAIHLVGDIPKSVDFTVAGPPLRSHRSQR